MNIGFATTKEKRQKMKKLGHHRKPETSSSRLTTLKMMDLKLRRLFHITYFIRDASWLSTDRVLAYSRLLVLVQAITLGIAIAGMNGFFGPVKDPVSIDFLSFYAAGHMADVGQAAAIYDQAQHYRAEQELFGAPGVSYFAFFYPPVFILVCAIFGWMPYPIALCFWAAATLAPFLVAMRRIVGSVAGILPVAAYPAVLLTLAVGQNSFLTAGLFTFGTVLLARKPFSAGLCLGALIFKPHFALLLPVALVAGREWRAMLGAMTMAAALAALSVIAFGTAPWRSFYELSLGTSRTFQNGSVDFALLISPFAAFRLMGGGVPAAWAVQGATTLLAMIAVALVWARQTRPGARAAVLIAATLIALPVALFYDMTLAVVALAWIARDARATGYHPWEKMGLLIVFCAPLMVIGLAHSFGWPIGPFASGLLLLLAIRRALVPPPRKEWRPLDLSAAFMSPAPADPAAARRAGR